MDRKAGMEAVDMEEANRFLQDMSKGTRYQKNEQKKEAILQQRVDQLLQKLEKIEEAEIDPNFELKIDRHIAVLEATRDLSQTWLHIDMDAFYASVEMQSRPDLQGKPVAVGSMDMLATSNYEARKWGVRAGLPGFLAVQLCPSLEILPLNFDKYRSVSRVIRAVFLDYDPNFHASSLDEATLDLTHYLSLHVQKDPVAVACEIRTKIFQNTALTCSIGIAPTSLLAKICAEVNKPNGYFHLGSNRDTIVRFMEQLPVGKVPGIGKVTTRLLSAIGITKCEGLLQDKALLFLLFPWATADFFARVALGIAHKRVKTHSGPRKSISRERTFRDFFSDEELVMKIRDLAADLAEDMETNNLYAKIFTLKLKTMDFEIRNRSVNLDRYISTQEDIFYYASELLKLEMPVDLRTLGLKLTDLCVHTAGSSNNTLQFIH